MTARYPDLGGRVAVVTGGALGIGAAISQRLAQEGMHVIVADFDQGALDDLVDEIVSDGGSATGHTADMRSSEDIDDLFQEAKATFGSVHVLINNAAHLGRARLLDDHDELLDLQLDVNLRAPYRCSQRAAALMRSEGGGSIIHISSVGAVRAHQQPFPYDVTKGALNAMTLAMAVDLGEYGIRVNSIGPGLTDTYRWDDRRGTPGYKALAATVPLRRFGTPSEMAAAVAFLASDESSYITGQILNVDGGMTVQLEPPPAPDGLPAASIQ
jgi:3-oxoacyl-[acyl-carrier protein] reductase